jgi:heptosyltransferase-2
MDFATVVFLSRRSDNPAWHMQPGKAQIDRILVRSVNWIGDAVMTTPALQRLRSSFPRARITLLAAPRIKGIFEDSPLFDEVIEYRRREEGARAFYQAARMIRRSRFDLAALFQNAFEAALLARLGGARLRIGFAEHGRGFLLTHKLHRGPQHRNRHQVYDYLDIIAECERVCLSPDFKPNDSNPLPKLVANTHQKQSADLLLRSSGVDSNSRPIVALNTGATNSRAKCWSADRFASLADRLIDDLDALIVLIGAGAERNSAERVIERMKFKGAINLAGRTTMTELIGLLNASDLIVTNDTGPAHIAAALGRPTLTIFGPTNEFETAPTGPRSEMIRAEGVECARCMLRDCPIDHRCMTRIKADEVFERAREMLRSPKSNQWAWGQ